MNGYERQIMTKRDAAARARRLAVGVMQEDVRLKILGFAAALDAEADALERSTSSPAPQTTQSQMQMQQGPRAKDKSDKKS